jgi:D-2-hydroxyacid dehydrogenase (NADP+)
MTGRVLIVHRQQDDLADALRAACPGADIRTAPEAEAPAALAEAEVLVTIGRWLTAEMVAKAPRLRWVQCTITGTDHLRAPLAARPDILLTNARGIHGPQMTETTLLHLLTLSRGGRRLARQQAARQAERFEPMGLTGRHAVILGVGAIAEHMAPVLKALGMRVTGVTDRPGPLAGFDALVPRAGLAAAAAEADALICLIPLRPDTRHIVDATVLSAMKPEGFVINMARGGIVEEAALIAALRAGRLAGAALDVFETWPLPPDSPLWEIDNLLISPFIGGHSDRYTEMLAPLVARNLRAWLSGEAERIENRIKRKD